MIWYLAAYMVIGIVVSLTTAFGEGEVPDTFYGIIVIVWPLWVALLAWAILSDVWGNRKGEPPCD